MAEGVRGAVGKGDLVILVFKGILKRQRVVVLEVVHSTDSAVDLLLFSLLAEVQPTVAYILALLLPAGAFGLLQTLREDVWLHALNRKWSTRS